MNTIPAPRLITTPVRQMNAELWRLEEKSSTPAGLTPDEARALADIYRAAEQGSEQPLSQHDVDAMAERDAEARRHGAFPGNFHE